MARSTYIYLITHDETGEPLAAFTVKYEMEKALEKLDIFKHRVYRIPDGKNASEGRQLTEITLDYVTG